MNKSNFISFFHSKHPYTQACKYAGTRARASVQTDRTKAPLVQMRMLRQAEQGGLREDEGLFLSR